jgi:hypothetical protein
MRPGAFESRSAIELFWTAKEKLSEPAQTRAHTQMWNVKRGWLRVSIVRHAACLAQSFDTLRQTRRAIQMSKARGWEHRANTPTTAWLMKWVYSSDVFRRPHTTITQNIYPKTKLTATPDEWNAHQRLPQTCLCIPKHSRAMSSSLSSRPEVMKSPASCVEILAIQCRSRARASWWLHSVLVLSSRPYHLALAHGPMLSLYNILYGYIFIYIYIWYT